MSKTNVYVLKLESGRYYVGKTDDVKKRFEEHQNGRGSAWTNRYAPLSLVETRKNVSSFEEDKVTKEYMAKYGIDKVRGGAYVSMELDESQRSALETEIRSATDKCTNCGHHGHFVKDCRMNKFPSRKSVTCYRCGTPGHYANTCNVNRGYVTYEYDNDSDEEDCDEDEYEDDSDGYDSD